MISWSCVPFSLLNTEQLYELLQLRVNVFIVEQQCYYADLDNNDRIEGTYHLLGYRNDELIAYARLLPPGTTYPGCSIGRVCIKQSARGGGIAHQLLHNAIEACGSFWPASDIDIGAQIYLCNFYQKHNFITISECYLEDNIPHIDMKLSR